MNSDKAADVRDSLNALPCVAYDPETDRMKLRRRTFKPARINEAGEIGFGDGQPRPCYEVVLEPLQYPHRPLPTMTIPPSVVHEIAKHGCRIRVTSGLRDDWQAGVIRVRDDLAHEDQPDNVDHCEDCGCTRFQLRDGLPTCERCGETHESAVEIQENELTISDFE